MRLTSQNVSKLPFPLNEKKYEHVLNQFGGAKHDHLYFHVASLLGDETTRKIDETLCLTADLDSSS